MQPSPALESVRQLHPEIHLASLDSGQERGLDHWLEISWLVEKEEDDLKGYLFDDRCLLISL